MFLLSVFPYEISEITFFTYSFYQNVTKLSKSNKTHSLSSSWHVDFKSKRISDLGCVEKKFLLLLFSYEIREFIFSYIAFFEMLGSCSNQTKLIVGVPHSM